MSDEKEIIVVTNQGFLGWFVAAIALVVLLGVGILAYSGYFNGSENVTIELQVPEPLTPSE